VIGVIRALVVPEVFREFPDQLGLQLEWLDLGERRAMLDRRATRVILVLKALQESREPMVRMVSMELLEPLDPLDPVDPLEPLDRRVIKDLPETLPRFLET
jgi:hypothetical protein